MRNLFSSPLGANFAPIGINKSVAVGVIPAILGAASIAGGIANTLSQADANKTNKQISDNQLAFAKEQYEREKEENRYLIHSQREYDRQVSQYNSPVEERKRLEAAGINPSLAKYGQSGMMLASQTGVGSPAQFKMPVPYKANPLDFQSLSQGIQNAALSYQQADMADAQVESIRQKTRNDYVELMSKLESSKIDNETKKMMQRDLSRHWTFENETWDARKEAIDLANQSIRENTEMLRLQQANQKFINSIAPELHEMEKERFAKDMSKVAAEIAEVFARRDLSLEQKKLVARQVTEQQIINKNLPKSLHNDNAIKVATYKKVVADAALINQQKKTEEWHTYDVMRGARINNIGNNRPLNDYVEVAIKNAKHTIK